ncbi:MAG: hypothetical protein ACYS0G_16185 [Planctomycetota bacterium]
MPPNHARCSVDWDAGAVRVTQNPAKSYRFLPFRPDHCTFLKLDGDAQVFLTGPFSGCNFYAGQGPGGEPICFHVNFNAEANRARNQAAKRAAAQFALGAYGAAGGQITPQLERDHYAPAAGQAYQSIVIGCNQGRVTTALHPRLWFKTRMVQAAGWSFYWYGWNAGGRVFRLLTQGEPILC